MLVILLKSDVRKGKTKSTRTEETKASPGPPWCPGRRRLNDRYSEHNVPMTVAVSAPIVGFRDKHAA